MKREHERSLPPEKLKEHAGFVKDSHQEGIKRVMLRKGDLQPGQGGKMMVHDHYKKSHKE